jgi:hypothetical protein
MPMLRDFVEQVRQAARAYPWIIYQEFLEVLAQELAQRGRI